MEVWAVHQALLEAGRDVPALAGLVAVRPPGFDTEGLRVLREEEFILEARPGEDVVVVAIGSPANRWRVAGQLRDQGFGFATLVHPTAILGPCCQVGEGSVVMASAVLETHVSVGTHALLNVQCSLAHGCALGSVCNLGPGAHLAGDVHMGDRCDLGVGAVVRPGIRMGNDVTVGAGGAVVRDWTGPVVLAGVPVVYRDFSFTEAAGEGRNAASTGWVGIVTTGWRWARRPSGPCG